MADTFAALIDGSSTESECYDDDATESTIVDKAENEASAKPSEVKEQSADSSTTTTEYAAPSKKYCTRCRQKLPSVSESEVTSVRDGKFGTKKCLCCNVDYPLDKFSLNNRSPARAIPRCRKCSQAKPEVLRCLRRKPEFAEAVEVERLRQQKEKKATESNLPPFERKSLKQRWEEQFTIVSGKTARERRLAERNQQKKEQIQRTRQHN